MLSKIQYTCSSVQYDKCTSMEKIVDYEIWILWKTIQLLKITKDFGSGLIFPKRIPGVFSPLPGLPVSNLLTQAHSPQIFLQLVLFDDVTGILNTFSSQNPANLPHEALNDLLITLRTYIFRGCVCMFTKYETESFPTN